MFISACSTVALTGRKQLLLVSDSEVLGLSNQSFKEYMGTAKMSANKTNTAMVERVGKNIATAVEAYLKSQGLESEIQNFAWEFHLVKDTSANAFCMPGGKIVVNEGILPYTKTEAGLAIVVGHEVAHAVAKHSAERMSQQLLVSYGGQALGTLMQKKSSTTQMLAQQVFGLGAQYGYMLPYSRKNEYEADRMGLVFAAMAGYNPEVAVEFWQRMSQGGKSIPAFLSTHPSDEARIANLKKVMPEALKYYKKK
ncbi:peptidase M48 [Bacteroides sedimenti]|uniref:Peptidase M48 n=2 Tax=Bacteroides sedimenti TaxID=2136147 RepID=A0ABN6Z6B0_9BACE